MSSGAWFKPKTYGYGNVPSTWQGWLVTFVFGAFVIAMVAAVRAELLSAFWGVAIVFAVTAAFLWLIKSKTDGPWGWRWGVDR